MMRIQNGEIDPSFLVTHHMSLDEAPAAYALFSERRNECIQVVMAPWLGLPSSSASVFPCNLRGKWESCAQP
jgi:hypothetical protein